MIPLGETIFTFYINKNILWSFYDVEDVDYLITNIRIRIFEYFPEFLKSDCKNFDLSFQNIIFYYVYTM